jgi:YD repeat-containing protein
LSCVYGYDDADRVTSEQNAEGAVNYGYDATDQLTSASGSRSESYSYDSGGNRTMTRFCAWPVLHCEFCIEFCKF